ncbi:somatostatin receptor type 4 [Elysia marginata]|uniref:Somatostatin receptor type 4 n=1 Tax=Elysia marginata TaxID=1093978 RepID=A0AAV4JFZ0_9GAST|nr:somatostatin receptor type 4 [Elysia marginata]
MPLIISIFFSFGRINWYLAARAVSDGGFLLATFLTWASDAFKLGFFHTDVFCQFLVFFPFLFGFLSVWLTVVVTVENYIRICKPFTVQKFCNVPIAKRAILSLTIVGLLLYNYPLWTTKVFVESGYDNTTHIWCRSDDVFAEMLRWLTFWDMFITLVVPSVVIIVLMAAITCSLITSLKRQTRLNGGPAGSRTQSGGATSRSNPRSNSSPQAKVRILHFFC